MPSKITYSGAEVTKAVLEHLGLVGGVWPCFVANKPDAPDQLVTVTDTAGFDNGRTMVDGELQGLFGVQITFRALTHRVGWLKGNDVQQALCEDVYRQIVSVEGTGYLVHCFSGVGDVLCLGPELPASVRRIFTLNAFLSIEEL